MIERSPAGLIERCRKVDIGLSRKATRQVGLMENSPVVQVEWFGLIDMIERSQVVLVEVTRQVRMIERLQVGLIDMIASMTDSLVASINNPKEKWDRLQTTTFAYILTGHGL